MIGQLHAQYNAICAVKKPFQRGCIKIDQIFIPSDGIRHGEIEGMFSH